MTTILKIFRWTIFYLTILFFLLLIVGLIAFSIFSLEFGKLGFKNEFYFYLSFLIPLAILLTLTGTLSKKNTNNKNWTIGGATILIAVAIFLIMFSLLIQTFGGWRTQSILFRNEKNLNITISEQIWDVGALGYDRNNTRIVKLRPVLKYLNQVTPVDTGSLDKTEWIFVNEDGDMH
jgi:hypothetical protein